MRVFLRKNNDNTAYTNENTLPCYVFVLYYVVCIFRLNPACLHVMLCELREVY